MDTNELLRANRQRRFRTQVGTVIERHDGHYLRYYVDGQDDERRKITELLCPLGTKSTVVEIRRRKRMSEINQAQRKSAPVPTDLTIGEFWSETYFPWVKHNRRASTSRGYEKLWTGYLEKDLALLSLKKYATTDATKFLTSLAPKLGRNTLHHIKSLLSGVFAHAAALGTVKDNPMRNASWLVNPGRKTARTVAYTIAETVAVLKAVERADAKLVWVLSAVMALRPSEIAGLKVEDIDGQWLHVRRAAPYGLPDEDTKTEGSARDLRIVEPVASLIREWLSACGSPSSGWLFSRPGNRPIDHSAFVARHIAPAAKKTIGARWSGLYGGRRGHGTAVTRLESLTAARQTLGHSSETVTAAAYALPDIEAGTAGLELYGQAIVAELEKPS
jgi:integrase